MPKYKHTVTGLNSTFYHIYQDHNRNVLAAISKLKTAKAMRSHRQYQNQMNKILKYQITLILISGISSRYPREKIWLFCVLSPFCYNCLRAS